MRISTPIFKLKRRARLLSRECAIPLHAALDRIAVEYGFRGWSHLASCAAVQRPANRLISEIRPGGVLLLAARPGQGKTLLGLELAAMASRAGMVGCFFTLDYTAQDVRTRMNSLSLDADLIHVDTADEISGPYIVDCLARIKGRPLAVIDYLQLLDQKRTNPCLGAQISALRQYAGSSGSAVVIISQIDRSFELADRDRPGMADVRLPNPLDLSLFDQACFLHEGEIHLESPS